MSPLGKLIVAGAATCATATPTLSDSCTGDAVKAELKDKKGDELKLTCEDANKKVSIESKDHVLADTVTEKGEVAFKKLPDAFKYLAEDIAKDDSAKHAKDSDVAGDDKTAITPSLTPGSELTCAAEKGKGVTFTWKEVEIGHASGKAKVAIKCTQGKAADDGCNWMIWGPVIGLVIVLGGVGAYFMLANKGGDDAGDEEDDDEGEGEEE